MRRQKPDPITTRGGLSWPERPPLRPHQERAKGKLLKRGRLLLHHHMGTGKTRTTIEAFEERGSRRVLVLAPKSVVAVWPLQLDKWAREQWACAQLDDLAGDGARKLELLRKVGTLSSRILVALNYDNSWREPLQQALHRFNFDSVVWDESHKLKAPGGKASWAAARFARHLPFRALLSGTPAPHSHLDYYAQFRAMAPEVFGTYFASYRARYSILDTRGGFPKVVGRRNQEEFAAKLAEWVDYAPADVLGLQEPVHERVVVELSARARKAYDELEENLSTEVAEGVVTAQNGLVALLRLEQLTGGCLPVENPDAPGEQISTRVDDSKERALEDLLEGLDADEPVAVFCRFRPDLDAVHRVAAKLKRASCELSGRRHDIRAIWYPEQPPVAAIQIQAGGLGIDLTRARVCVFYSVGFSYGDYEQALARLQRQGQTRVVLYYHLVARGTVDESKYGSLQRKENVVETIIAEFRAAQRQGTLDVERAEPAA